MKTRAVECSTKDGDVVDHKFCAMHPKPNSEEACNADDLPACQVQWYATQWSNVSIQYMHYLATHSNKINSN